MPIFTIPIHEANDCHMPPGSAVGGQFCGDGSSQTGQQKFTALQKQWDKLNQRLLDAGLHPDTPTSKAYIALQLALVKEMYKLDVNDGAAALADDLTEPGGVRDVVVVGAGPGGLTAALNAGYERYDTLLIEAGDKVGGQAKFSSRVENFPGFTIGVKGAALAEELHEQVKRTGAETKLGVRVIGMTYDEATGNKTLKLSNGETVVARAVIVAAGLEFKKLPPFKGDDAKNIIYADPATLAVAGAGKPVVIIGGSNGAAQAALQASRDSTQVTVLARRAVDTGGMSRSQVSALKNNPKIKIVIDEMAEVVKDAAGNPTEILTKTGQRLPAAALGIFVGAEPQTGWLGAAKKATSGKIITDDRMMTSIPGVFAIGDVRERRGQSRMIVAAGEGAVAVGHTYSFFMDQKLGKLKR